MLNHGSLPSTGVCQNTPRTLNKCTCAESISSINELCQACKTDYENWLENEQHESRAEARLMSSRELAEAWECAA